MFISHQLVGVTELRGAAALGDVWARLGFTALALVATVCVFPAARQRRQGVDCGAARFGHPSWNIRTIFRDSAAITPNLAGI